MVKKSLKNITKEGEKAIKTAKDFTELNKVFKDYLGKKGEISAILRSLKKIPKARRVKTAKKANEAKHFLLEKIDEKKKKLSAKVKLSKGMEETFDITVPGKRLDLGHLHPLTITQRNIVNIFQLMGFVYMVFSSSP